MTSPFSGLCVYLMDQAGNLCQTLEVLRRRILLVYVKFGHLLMVFKLHTGCVHFCKILRVSQKVKTIHITVMENLIRGEGYQTLLPIVFDVKTKRKFYFQMKSEKLSVTVI